MPNSMPMMMAILVNKGSGVRKVVTTFDVSPVTMIGIQALDTQARIRRTGRKVPVGTYRSHKASTKNGDEKRALTAQCAKVMANGNKKKASSNKEDTAPAHLSLRCVHEAQRFASADTVVAAIKKVEETIKRTVKQGGELVHGSAGQASMLTSVLPHFLQRKKEDALLSMPMHH